MMARFQRQWDLMVDGDRQPDPLLDFGFNDPDAAELYGYWFYVSGFNPDVLPRPGGLAAQSRRLEQDLRMWLTGLGRTQWEYQQFQQAKHEGK